MKTENPKVFVIRKRFVDFEKKGIVCGESLTKQSMKDECDINNILKRYEKTGVVNGNTSEGMYGDFSSVVDYQEAFDIVVRAKNQFDNLPAEVRDRFANDPERFLSFVGDAKNKDECIRMGLMVKKEEIVEKPQQLNEQVNVKKKKPKEEESGIQVE